MSTQTVVYASGNIPYLSSNTTLVWLLEHTSVVHQAEEHVGTQWPSDDPSCVKTPFISSARSRLVLSACSWNAMPTLVYEELE